VGSFEKSHGISSRFQTRFALGARRRPRVAFLFHGDGIFTKKEKRDSTFGAQSALVLAGMPRFAGGQGIAPTTRRIAMRSGTS